MASGTDATYPACRGCDFMAANTAGGDRKPTRPPRSICSREQLSQFRFVGRPRSREESPLVRWPSRCHAPASRLFPAGAPLVLREMEFGPIGPPAERISDSRRAALRRRHRALSVGSPGRDAPQAVEVGSNIGHDPHLAEGQIGDSDRARSFGGIKRGWASRGRDNSPPRKLDRPKCRFPDPPLGIEWRLTCQAGRPSPSHRRNLRIGTSLPNHGAPADLPALDMNGRRSANAPPPGSCRARQAPQRNGAVLPESGGMRKVPVGDDDSFGFHVVP